MGVLFTSPNFAYGDDFDVFQSMNVVWLASTSVDIFVALFPESRRPGYPELNMYDDCVQVPNLYVFLRDVYVSVPV